MTGTFEETEGRANARLAQRAAVLFLNFLLIILAYYQVKSASRSLLIEYWGAGSFPYVWIVSALVLGTFIGFYHRLVERFSRFLVVLGTLLLLIGLLIGFRALFLTASGPAALAFYVFVDIFSVILVEQFWSLTNTVNDSREGKKSYWFIGTGGLLGGVVGAGSAAFLVSATPMQTPDLLLSCAGLLAVTFVVNLAIGRMGLYDELRDEEPPAEAAGGWRSLLANRYLLLIAAALFCAQIAQPVVEFQFLKAIEAAYSDLDERTAFIGEFFGVLGLVSIAVNLALTPLIHRYLGIMAGMLVQPVLLAVCSFGFIWQPTLAMASAMKISDRGLSYSINRASKEQLYIPVDPVLTYQAKAWIDMLGYRLFKIAGAGLIIVYTEWFALGDAVAPIGWLTLAICASWALVIAALSREYRLQAPQPVFA